MPYIEKKIVSGKLVEIEQYFSLGKRIPRGERRGITSLTQAEQNEKQSEKDFIRQLYCNFDPAHGDMFVTLTFSEAVNHAGAARAFRNFELRAKRYCEKNKTEYKRLSIIEKQGQYHIHMVVSGLSTLPLTELQTLWGHGHVKQRILDDSNNYKDLARYLFRGEKPSKTDPDNENTKPPRYKHAKRWSGTRNIKKPVVTRKVIKRESIMSKLPTAPKGYELLSDWSIYPDDRGYLIRRYAYIKLSSPTPPKKKPSGTRRKPPSRE